jgi:DMSO/TMAO reductase YedYZ heme-binding membrane subunit
VSVGLRAAVGLLLALGLPRVELPDAVIAWVFVLGWLAFASARALVYVEPRTRDAVLAAPQSQTRHIGEALFGALGLLMALLASDVLFGTASYPAAIAVVTIVYLIAHAVAYMMLEMYLKPSGAAPRPLLRRYIRAGAGFAEQVALAAGMTMAEGARRDMVAGPWSGMDVLTLPLVGVGAALLIAVPLLRITRAAADRELPPARDVITLHVAALYLFALTGQQL